MYKLLEKFGGIAGLGLGGIILIIYIIISKAEKIGSYSDEVLLSKPFFTFTWGLGVTEVLLAIAIFAALAFGILNIMKDPSKGMGLLIGLGVLVILFLICMFSFGANDSGQVVGYIKDNEISSGSNKLINGLLGTGVVLFILSILGAIGMEVYSKIRK